ATCHDGLICGNGSSPCIGRHSVGCYNPAYATCSDGVVCPAPLQACFGRHGAQCYDPSRATCEAGQRTFRPRRGAPRYSRVHHDLSYTVPSTTGGTAHVTLPRYSTPYH